MFKTQCLCSVWLRNQVGKMHITDPGPQSVQVSQGHTKAGRGRVEGSRKAWWVQPSTRMQEEKGETWVDVGMTAQDILYHGKPSHNCRPAAATR